MTLKFDIKRLGRSPNRLRGLGWQIYKAEKDKWLKDLALKLWPVAHKNPKAFAEIRVERFSSNPMDDDNVAASCKPLLDSLKDLGFIVDDSPHWIHLKAVWRKGKRGNGFTRVSICYKI